MLSALIQNFDTVEEVIETSANSAGSALKENERYLDSIQGKIDQFNNAMQAMWNDTLDSDVVKWFVGLGTEIIKIIDKVGLLKSALLAFGAYKGFGALFASLKNDGVTLKSVWNWINQLTLATRAQQVADAAAAGTTLSRSNAEKLLNLSIVKRFATEQIDAKVKEANRIRKVSLVTATQALALAEEQYADGLIDDIALQTAKNAVDAASVPITSSQIDVTTILGATFKGLAASIWGAVKAITAFLFTNPVGWIILAIGAIAGGIAIFNHFHKTTEELTEELNELKTELQDVQSEIETVNSDLKTMQDRIAELLAKDSLSFVEQEELDRLQKENNELQRRLDLLEEEEKIKQNKAAETFVQTMESYGDKTYKRGGEMNLWQRLWSGDSAYAESQDEYINKLMSEYDRVLKVDSGELDRSVLVDEMDADWYSEKIGAEVQALVDAANGLDYFEGDNLTDKQKEVNEWLDYVYNTQDKLAIMRGGANAKTNAINRIFDKDENAAISDSIDEYVEALKNGDKSAKEKIDSIIRGNADLVADLQASGIQINDEINEATDYFTSFASELEFATLEGKIKEVSKAATNFESLLKGGLFKVDGVDTGLSDLFDEEGKIIQTKLSQVFQGTSEQTRAEITRLLEGSYDMIADGLDDAEINYLMNRMRLSFSRAILEIEKTSLATKNLELFPGLEDEISGIIDTFSELTSAVGSVVDAMDTLDKARAEEAYSGSMSLETLEALMKSTDNYADLIEVDETGAIKLATNAQEILVAQKLEAIKQNAALALEEAELAYQEALHTEQTYSQTGPAQDFMRGLWNEVGGAMSFVGSLWSDLTSGNWDGAWDRAKQAREGSITTKETEYSAKAAEASVAVAEAAKNVENAEKMNQIAQGFTPKNVKGRYSSDEASGGADDPEEVAENAFQKEMDYWENRIAANQAKYEQLQNEIDLLEKKGQKADASYYQEQVQLEGQRLTLLQDQKTAAETHLATLEEGSEEWWEVANVLNGLESDIDNVTASIVDLQDAIGEIDTYKFEEFNNRLDDITSKLGTIRDLIAPDEEDWFDDQGEWTEEGVAVLGTYIQELETYKQGLAKAEEAYKQFAYETDDDGNFRKDENGNLIARAYEGNEDWYAQNYGIHSEQEYYDKQEELINQQYDYAESIDDTERSIVDMYESSIDAVEEYTETLIDSYNDYIDSVKEALSAERD